MSEDHSSSRGLEPASGGVREPHYWGLLETPDRTWRIDIYGPGQIKATDIMSPTGYFEWITRDQLNRASRP